MLPATLIVPPPETKKTVPRVEDSLDAAMMTTYDL